MDTQSQHLIADIWLSDELKNEHIDHLKKIVETNLTVVERVEHKFTPHGETIVFILSESHFSIHTYPEEKYLSLDLYICNMSTDLEEILAQMTDKLPVSKVDKKILGRGIKPVELETSHDKNKRLSLFLLTFFTAFCSIIYELLLAQTLATTMGDTVLRYNITIGLYIASMGIGALLYSRFNQKYQILNLIRIELLISIVGGLAPISVLIFDSIFQQLSFAGHLSYMSSFSQLSINIFNYGLIILVGLISGAELPLLMDIGRKIKQDLSGKILATDYLGTLAGSVSFPIFIIPYFHLFSIGYLVAFLNTMVAAILLVVYKQYKNYKYVFFCGITLLVYLLLMINNDSFNSWIINKFYYLNMGQS